MTNTAKSKAGKAHSVNYFVDSNGNITGASIYIGNVRLVPEKHTIIKAKSLRDLTSEVYNNHSNLYRMANKFVNEIKEQLKAGEFVSYVVLYQYKGETHIDGLIAMPNGKTRSFRHSRSKHDDKGNESLKAVSKKSRTFTANNEGVDRKTVSHGIWRFTHVYFGKPADAVEENAIPAPTADVVTPAASESAEVAALRELVSNLQDMVKGMAQRIESLESEVAFLKADKKITIDANDSQIAELQAELNNVTAKVEATPAPAANDETVEDMDLDALLDMAPTTAPVVTDVAEKETMDVLADEMDKEEKKVTEPTTTWEPKKPSVADLRNALNGMNRGLSYDRYTKKDEDDFRIDVDGTILRDCDPHVESMQQAYNYF